MMKLATLMFFVAAASAGAIHQPAVESTEPDMEGAATFHHGLYERNIGLYAGAIPAVYPGGYAAPSPYYQQSAYPISYPSAYSGYSSGYGGGGYGYPYRPAYAGIGLGLYAGK